MKTKLESDTGSNPPACSRSSDTPETDAMWEKHSGTNAELAIDAIALCGKLERERNALREGFDLDGNDAREACCGAFKREQAKRIAELESAIRNLCDVSGRHHSEIATKRLFALLPENA